MDSNLLEDNFTPAPPIDKKTVGFWMSDKKIRDFKIHEFSQYCLNHGLELVKIHFDKPLEEQGPFSAIVHKLSDVIIRGEQGNAEAKDMCRRFEEYAACHPEMAVIDPLPNVRQLLDRYRQYKIIRDCNLGSTVFTPPFVELTTNDVEENYLKLKQHKVDFPIVCKPSVAHGSTLAHQMSLIFGPQGLADVRPPCVAQTFVCHGAVLYKIFIVGQRYHVIERPSLKNFKSGKQDTIFFDSHDISKTTSTSWLIKLDEEDQESVPLQPEPQALETIARLLQRRLGLDLFGIDVIVDSSNGNYAIIDINTFPGYKGFPNLWEELSDLIYSRMAPETRSTTPSGSSCTACQSVGLSVRGGLSDQLPCLCCPVNASCNRNRNRSSQQMTETGGLKDSANSTEDSGIDTSDSCDEKKLTHCPVVKNVKRQHSKSANLPLTNDKLVCH